jgi:uncharacterized integral membrane protein
MPQEKKPVSWRTWIAGILGALALIVALQNSQEVSVDILFVSTEAPLIAILLITLAIGALVGYLFPVVRRHRREERRQGSA